MQWRLLLLSISLAVVALVTYSNSYQGEFVFDDRGSSILENPTIWDLSRFDLILHPPDDATVTNRPLLNLTLALNFWWEYADSTTGYHAVNVMIHIANGLLLFGLVRRTLLGPRLIERFGFHATGLAFACALLWIVHPLCTSSVTYIAQRAESLMTMFLLLTLYCSARADQSERHHTAWGLAAICACAFGMASKEIMVVAPLLVPLYRWIFGRESMGELIKRRAWFHAGLAATLIVLLLATSTGTRRSVAFNFFGEDPLIDVASWDYAKTQAPIILHYLRLVIWPHPLVLDYDWPIVTSASQWLPHAIVVVLLGVASLWALFRRRAVGFLGVLFFLMLAPTSSFLVIYLEVAAEHRMYLPLGAVIIVLVFGCWRAGRSLMQRVGLSRSVAARIGWSSVILIAILLSWRTYQRNFVFHDRMELWRQTVADAPRAARPHNNLAIMYGLGAKRLMREAGRLEREGDVERALARSEEASQYTQKQIELLTRAIELKPNYPDPYYNLARVLRKQRKNEEAMENFRLAIQYYRGRDSRPNEELGLLLAEQGDFDAAIEQLEMATQLTPDYGPHRLSLADVLIQQRAYRRAREELEAATRFDKHYLPAWRRLAEVLAMAPDESVRDGAKAFQISQDLLERPQQGDVQDMETLAAALAETGSFDQAAELAKKLSDYYREHGSSRWKVMEQREREYAAGRRVFLEEGVP